MVQKASVAVVIALYNGSKHVIRALDSVFNQTLVPSEIIVVDDGSSDGGVDLIQKWIHESGSHIPFRVIGQSNSGQGLARNAGVRSSEAEWIAFLDQDDIWYSNHLEMLISIGQSNDQIGWVFSSFSEIDEKGNQINWDWLKSSNYQVPRPNLDSLLADDLMMLPSSSLIRRDAFNGVGGFDSQFRGYEDDDLFLRIFIFGGFTFAFVDIPTIAYRIHSGNSSSTSTFWQSRARFYQKWKDFLYENELGAVLHNNFAPRVLHGYYRDIRDGYQKGASRADPELLQNVRNVYEDIGFSRKRKILLKLLSRKETFILMQASASAVPSKYRQRFLNPVLTAK